MDESVEIRAESGQHIISFSELIHDYAGNPAGGSSVVCEPLEQISLELRKEIVTIDVVAGDPTAGLHAPGKTTQEILFVIFEKDVDIEFLRLQMFVDVPVLNQDTGGMVVEFPAFTR